MKIDEWLIIMTFARDVLVDKFRWEMRRNRRYRRSFYEEIFSFEKENHNEDDWDTISKGRSYLEFLSKDKNRVF